MKRLFAMLSAVMLCICLFVGCGGDTSIETDPYYQAPVIIEDMAGFLGVMKRDVPAVSDLFGDMTAKTSLIANQYVLYEDGQYAVYAECVFADEAAYIAEKQRLLDLTTSLNHAGQSDVDEAVVPGATKIALNYNLAVMGYMFDSGCMVHALCYDETKTVVYVAISENPLYTFSQHIPEQYIVTADLHEEALKIEAENAATAVG